MTRDYKLFIKDIAEAIRDIEDFIGEMDYEEFFRDRKTQKAVVWQIHPELRKVHSHVIARSGATKQSHSLKDCFAFGSQ